MTPSSEWRQRPREQANLFNPAFLAVLIERCANGHEERSGEGLPWSLVALALPVTLHKETREALPERVTSSMAAWTAANPLLVAPLADRARVLGPLVRESLLFGLSHQLVALDGDRLRSGGLAKRKSGAPWRDPTDDFRSCATTAAFFGRWCAVSGLPATVFALWGARP